MQKWCILLEYFLNHDLHHALNGGSLEPLTWVWGRGCWVRGKKNLADDEDDTRQNKAKRKIFLSYKVST
jgi:hypothetical protein